MLGFFVTVVVGLVLVVVGPGAIVVGPTGPDGEDGGLYGDTGGPTGGRGGTGGAVGGPPGGRGALGGTGCGDGVGLGGAGPGLHLQSLVQCPGVPKDMQEPPSQSSPLSRLPSPHFGGGISSQVVVVSFSSSHVVHLPSTHFSLPIQPSGTKSTTSVDFVVGDNDDNGGTEFVFGVVELTTTVLPEVEPEDTPMVPDVVVVEAMPDCVVVVGA